MGGWGGEGCSRRRRARAIARRVASAHRLSVQPPSPPTPYVSFKQHTPHNQTLNTRPPHTPTSQDLVHLQDFTSWLRNEGPGATGRHNAVKSFFYWCYNANSGGEGGGGARGGGRGRGRGAGGGSRDEERSPRRGREEEDRPAGRPANAAPPPSHHAPPPLDQTNCRHGRPRDRLVARVRVGQAALPAAAPRPQALVPVMRAGRAATRLQSALRRGRVRAPTLPSAGADGPSRRPRLSPSRSGRENLLPPLYILLARNSRRSFHLFRVVPRAPRPLHRVKRLSRSRRSSPRSQSDGRRRRRAPAHRPPRAAWKHTRARQLPVHT